MEHQNTEQHNNELSYHYDELFKQFKTGLEQKYVGANRKSDFLIDLRRLMSKKDYLSTNFFDLRRSDVYRSKLIASQNNKLRDVYNDSEKRSKEFEKKLNTTLTENEKLNRTLLKLTQQLNLTTNEEGETNDKKSSERTKESNQSKLRYWLSEQRYLLVDYLIGIIKEEKAREIKNSSL